MSSSRWASIIQRFAFKYRRKALGLSELLIYIGIRDTVINDVFAVSPVVSTIVSLSESCF